MKNNKGYDLIDWKKVDESWTKWKNEEIKTPYWDSIIKASKNLLENFKIENDNFDNVTIENSDKLRDLVLKDLYNHSIGSHSFIINEIDLIYQKNMMCIEVIKETIQELEFFSMLIKDNYFYGDESIIHQIQSKYLFHSVYSKMDILRFKYQTMYSILELDIKNDNAKILKRIELLKTSRGILNVYDSATDKFIKRKDIISSRYFEILDVISKVRNQEAHTITDSEKRLMFFIREGTHDSYFSNYKSLPTWLSIAFIIIYSAEFNNDALNEFRNKPENFNRYINGEYLNQY